MTSPVNKGYQRPTVSSPGNAKGWACAPHLKTGLKHTGQKYHKRNSQKNFKKLQVSCNIPGHNTYHHPHDKPNDNADDTTNCHVYNYGHHKNMLATTVALQLVASAIGFNHGHRTNPNPPSHVVSPLPHTRLTTAASLPDSWDIRNVDGKHLATDSQYRALGDVPPRQCCPPSVVRLRPSPRPTPKPRSLGWTSARM